MKIENSKLKIYKKSVFFLHNQRKMSIFADEN